MICCHTYMNIIREFALVTHRLRLILIITFSPCEAVDPQKTSENS